MLFINKCNAKPVQTETYCDMSSIKSVQGNSETLSGYRSHAHMTLF